MNQVEEVADIVLAAARGCPKSQLTIARQALLHVEAAGEAAPILYLQALCYARLAAAQGDPDGIMMTIRLSSVLAVRAVGTPLDFAIPNLEGDALALLDLAADLASPSAADQYTVALERQSKASGDDGVERAGVHREFWGHATRHLEVSRV